MKLATINNHQRDGELIVVNRSLSHYTSANDIAPTLQYALDHWTELQADLTTLSDQLNAEQIEALVLQPKQLMAPLPRAFQWADGSAYVNHVELVRQARGAEMPQSFWSDPLMYQGGSDVLLACRDDITVADEAWGIDFEAEVAVITDDVPMQATETEAEQAIRLVMLVNDVSLRNLIAEELAKGFGFFHSKPASAFSAVAVTLDELDPYWHDGKLHRPLISQLNGALFGEPNAGVDMTFNFPQLIAHAAKTRNLTAGSIIGSGTVSNVDRSKGSSCIAEKRMLEKIAYGDITTPFMKFGDRIKIDMTDESGNSIFGAIEQTVVASANKNQ